MWIDGLDGSCVRESARRGFVCVHDREGFPNYIRILILLICIRRNENSILQSVCSVRLYLMRVNNF